MLKEMRKGLNKVKKNVLVFSGGSYPGIEIYYALQHNLLFNPIGISSYSDHSEFVFKDFYTKLPYIQEPNFIDELNKVIYETNSELIIPTHDTIALFLMKNESKINAKIVCSPLFTAELCRYKSKTYDYFKNDFFVPKIYKDISNLEYPVFCKKDVSEGSKDAYLIKTTSDFSQINNIDDYVICEYLPGEEITIDCFTDRHGKLRFINPRIRLRIMNGISARAQNIELTEEVQKIVSTINEKTAFRGYWFVQLKKDIHGNFKLLEISTRFSGTFNLSQSLDVNLPLLALCDKLDMEVDILPNTYTVTSDKTYIDRYKIDYNYQRVYIDFDDTIAFNREKLNTLAMMFLYQCKNEKKDLVLITKHEYDIYETLTKLNIDKDLFSSILRIPINEYKYLYINNDVPSIFIDNAFIERKFVKNHTNIPTLDVSNISVLIDWS